MPGRHHRRLSLPACFLLYLAFLSQAVLGSILAIDYGSEWIKASLMKPGVPFDVLLNRDSKRKIQSSVGWKGHDRLFGSDAFNIATRFPGDSFSYLKSLQGVYFDSSAVSFHTKISQTDLIPSPRNTVSLRRPDGTEWSVEELIAMQLSYVKDLGESAGGEKVQDVVITVPAFFTQFERDAVADAVEIAGMRMLALINDGTAVAVNYAMTRTFATPEYHVIFDAGASSVRATVVAFSSAGPDTNSKASSTTTKDATVIQVAGMGFNREAGGTEVDRRLRDILAKDFESKHGKDITVDKRGMAKLFKEANRIKAVLSANTEAFPTIESVAFDIDFRSKVTRSTLESACNDLKPKFAQPIKDALANAGLTLSNITSVILTGGHSRTPMVQAAVKAVVGEDKIATNVNADEAAVLGAAFYGASVSRQFRTKPIKIQDIVAFDIQISYPSEKVSSASGSPKMINTVVFPAGSKVGSKKTLTFKRKDDFVLRMGYKMSPGPGIPKDLFEAQITGVKDALANLTEVNDPVIKATVVLSESGFATVEEVYAYGEIKETFAGKLKNLFGGGSGSEESSSDAEAQSSESQTPLDASQASESASPEESAAAKKGKEKIQNNIPLALELTPLSIPALTRSQVREARSRLVAIDNAEAAVRRREDARNSLEAYLYRLRDLLESYDSESPFLKCSQEAERRDLAHKLDEAMSWLHEEADEADTLTFWNKRDSLERLERPIQHRYEEIEAFPEALNNSQKWNFMTRMFLTDARANLTAEEEAGLPSKWTHEELDGLERTLKEHEAWLDENVQKQKSVRMNEDPVIETKEMGRRAKELEGALARLSRRKVAKTRKTASSTSSSTSATSASAPTGTDTGRAGGEEGESTKTISAEEPQKTHDEL